MKITQLEPDMQNAWNEFVAEHFPPVGAFLQSYEWGTFKGKLHGSVERFVIEEDGEWIGCFHMEIHKMPFAMTFGLCYGYAPRGPVLRSDVWKDAERVDAVFTTIADFLRTQKRHLLFVRFEPAHPTRFPVYKKKNFKLLAHYLQPRYNQLVPLAPPEALQHSFVADVRHDIRAAERMGITITSADFLSDKEYAAFEEMKHQTRDRSGKNIFPEDPYFAMFLSTFAVQPTAEKSQPTVRYFVATNKDGDPVAINLNILFGKTLTYLYGASYSGSLSKRAPAYLHWKSMCYAHENGFAYYDLGGVDEKLWPGLTYFKKQFGGETYEYVGTYDLVIQPFLYWLYILVKKIAVQ